MEEILEESEFWSSVSVLLSPHTWVAAFADKHMTKTDSLPTMDCQQGKSAQGPDLQVPQVHQVYVVSVSLWSFD